MKLRLPQALLAQVTLEARKALPGECCGLLLGHRDGDLASAVALHPARNLSPERERFQIAPDDHFPAVRRARSAGLQVIGCYHSHPHGQAAPSAADLAGAGEEDFVWLIATPDAMAAFVYSRGRFTGADLVTSSS